MSDAHEIDLDPTTQDIFDLMRRQPGDVFSREDLAGQLDSTPAEIEAGLATLARLGFVDKAGTTTGAEAFILSPSAPEL
jgi:DNA-binding IclR family transcriptional regulator